MREDDVRATYRFLGHAYETEVRVINPVAQCDVKSVFVYSEDEFVNTCRRFEGKYNIYVGINERESGGTKRNDVKSINAFIIDIDPKRTRGLPSSDSELRKAAKVAEAVAAYIKSTKKRPYVAMSGNGYQVWLKLDVPLTDKKFARQMETALQMMQRFFSQKFSTDDVNIDIIGDLPRVIKVIGTKSIKANAMSKRKNRFSKWVTIPKNPKPHVKWGMRIASMAREVEVRRAEDYKPPEEKLRPVDIDDLLSKIGKETLALFNGMWKPMGFKSRSEAEFGLIVKFKLCGIKQDDAWRLMEFSRIGKWHEGTDAYRRLTITKVYND